MPTSDAANSSPESNAEHLSVHIRFAPSQERRLKRPEPLPAGLNESLWVERPVLMERADGTYDLIGTSGHFDGLTRWLLSFGTDARVEGPERLRRQVAMEARRIWEQYNDE